MTVYRPSTSSSWELMCQGLAVLGILILTVYVADYLNDVLLACFLMICLGIIVVALISVLFSYINLRRN